MKKIFSKFSKDEKALAKAVKYMADNEGASEEAAIEAVELEISAEEIAALKQENEALKAEVAALMAKLGEGEEAAKASAAEAETAAKEALAAKDAEIAEIKGQLSAATQRLARYGVRAVVTEKLSKEQPPKEAKTISLSEFNKLPHRERNAFMATGGKISD